MGVNNLSQETYHHSHADNVRKKVYLVKREVVATSVKQALTAKGVIYEVVESNQEPPKKKEDPGFKNEKDPSKKKI